jgi:hypothetical protein
MRIRFTLDITRSRPVEEDEPQREGAYSQAELSPQNVRDFADQGDYEFEDRSLGFQRNP